MTEMGVKISHVLLGVLIFILVFLTNIGINGSTELQEGEAFVCGPRTIYGEFKVIEKSYEPCETILCYVEREIIVHEKQVYYCCPGYLQTGTSCSEECDADHYGENCTQICTCAAEHATGCNAASGDCDCVPGKGGANCTDDCSQGTFGVSCRGNCSCSHVDVDATCEPMNGNCNCSSEFYGDKCEFKYPTTASWNTKIGSTKDSSKDIAISSRTSDWMFILLIVCAGIIVVLAAVIASVSIWKCRKRKTRVTRRNSSAVKVATDPYYSSIPGDVPQGAGSTTGTTSLNLVTRGMNDSENARNTPTEPVAYETSIGFFEATTETSLESITHTYMEPDMEGQPNLSGQGVPRKMLNESTQPSTDNIVAYAVSTGTYEGSPEMNSTIYQNQWRIKELSRARPNNY